MFKNYSTHSHFVNVALLATQKVIVSILLFAFAFFPYGAYAIDSLTSSEQVQEPSIQSTAVDSQEGEPASEIEDEVPEPDDLGVEPPSEEEPTQLSDSAESETEVGNKNTFSFAEPEESSDTSESEIEEDADVSGIEVSAVDVPLLGNDLSPQASSSGEIEEEMTEFDDVVATGMEEAHLGVEPQNGDSEGSSDQVSFTEESSSENLAEGELVGEMLEQSGAIAITLAEVAVPVPDGEELEVEQALEALWSISTTKEDIEAFVTEETEGGLVAKTVDLVGSLFIDESTTAEDELTVTEERDIIAGIAQAAATDAVVSDDEINDVIEDVVPEATATDVWNGSTQVITVTVTGPDGPVEVPFDALSFVAGSVVLVVEPVWSQTPGSYEIVITITNPITGVTETITQNFLWGVLAMNTDKSGYEVGETGVIDFGVLNHDGAVVCDADLVLTVTAESGSSTELSTANGDIIVSETCGELTNEIGSDYTTSYTFADEGVYTLELDAVTANGAYSDVTFGPLTRSVGVGEVAPAIISRDMNTRVFPEEDANVVINVEFLTGFTGELYDVVPLAFDLSNIGQNGDVDVSESGASQVIVWEVEALAGETVSLSYTYNAPDVSPEFYVVGPLQSADGSIIEQRVWQIANDAPTGPGGVDDAGLTLWLDASDSTSLFTDPACTTAAANGNTIGCWQDKSGQANHVSVATNDLKEPTYNTNQLNGLATLDFFQDSLVAPDADQITASSDYTKFIVFKYDVLTGPQNILSSSNGGSHALYGIADGKINIWHGGPFLSSPTSLGIIEYNTVSARYAAPGGGTNILNVNGTLTDSNTTVQNLNLVTKTEVGSHDNGGNNLDGKIAEAIIYDRALTDEEIVTVECYLSAKWNTNVATICPSPGGIIASLSLWLKADAQRDTFADGDAVTTAMDFSGSANDGDGTGHAPTFQNDSTNNINFNPVYEFDGTPGSTASTKYFEHTTLLGGTLHNDTTVYIVQNVQGASGGGTFGEAIVETTDGRFMAHNPLGTGVFFGANGGDGWETYTPSPALLNRPVVQTFGTDSNSGEDKYIRENGAQVDDGVSITTAATGKSAPFYVGCGIANGVTTAGWCAHTNIAEIVVYVDNLSQTTSERQQIESYLALKYGIPMDASAGDYLDSSGNSVFDLTAGYTNDVIGIAKDSSSSLDQQISKSVNATGGVTLSTDTDFTSANGTHADLLTTGQYVVIAHDGAPTTTTQFTDLPAVHSHRIAREWRAENTDNVGDINIKFHGMDDRWTLVTDADGDFTSGSTNVGVLSPTGEITATLPDGHSFALMELIPSPGGIDADLTLWLKASDETATDGASITSATDYSLEENHGDGTGHTPLYENDSTNNINFNPVYGFDGTLGQYFEHSSLTGTTTHNKASVYMVRRNQTIGSGATFGEDILAPTFASRFMDIVGSTVRWLQNSEAFEAYVSLLPTGQSVLMAFQVSDTSGENKSIRENGLTITTATNPPLTFDSTITSFTGNNSPFFVGCGVDTVGAPTSCTVGDIAEIAVYMDGSPIGTERQQIESYFAIKYGMTLASSTNSDYLDTEGNSIYDLTSGYAGDVIGLGQSATSSLDQRISKSENPTGVLTLSSDADFTSANTAHASTTISEAQYLVIGNNSGATTTQVTDMDATLYGERTIREWRAENTNSVGAVNLKFDGFDDSWVLLTDADGSFTTGSTNAGTLSGTGEITGVTLTDGLFFTLAKLPTLIEFEVAAASDVENTGGNLPNLLIDGTLTFDADIDVVMGAAGDALAGTDYTLGGVTAALPQTITITIPAGTYASTTPVALSSLNLSGSTSVAFTITGDTEVETDETIDLTLSNEQPGLFIADVDAGGLIATHIYTITNDDSVLLEFSADSSDVEATGGNLPQILVLGTVTATTTVDVVDAISGSATEGAANDYSFVTPVTVTIPAGTYTGVVGDAVTITGLTINDDGITEIGGETINFTLSNATGDAAIGDADLSGGAADIALTYTITDDDIYTVSIEQTTNGAEPATDAEFTVSVSPVNTSGAAIEGTIAYSGGATEGTDYATGTATFSIADTASTTVVMLTPIDDVLVEGTETIIATIATSTPATEIGTSSATASITDNDDYQFSIVQKADGAEPSTNAVFTVSIAPDNNTGAAVTGNLTYAGTALEGTDYANGSTTFSIANAASTTDITLTTIDETIVEATETIIATISNVSTGTIAVASSTANLIDDDAYSVSITQSADGAEANGGATSDVQFIVTVTPANVSGAAIEGTIIYTGTALEGTDYATAPATFSIANTQVTAGVNITVTEDFEIETGGETIIATIATSTAAVNIGTASATASIIDDDIVVVVPEVLTITDDTGASTTDRITMDNQLFFNGTATGTVTSVDVYLDGVFIGTAPVVLETWAYDHSGTTLADATYSVTAIGKTAGGQPSATSTAVSIEVDTVDPAAPGAPTSPVTGASVMTTDIVGSCGTDAANGTASFTTDAANGFAPYPATATLDASGNYNITGFSWTDGTYDLNVECYDLAGNGPATTTVLDVDIDTVAPAAPVVTSPIDNSTVATSTPVVGTCEAGATVEIASTDISPNPTTGTCTASSTFSIATNFSAVAATTMDISVTQTDEAGNQSTADTVTGLQIDSDGDGVGNVDESTGFNGGDGNGDGTPDYLQQNVARFTDGVTNAQITLESIGGCPLVRSAAGIPESTAAAQDANFDYPFGLFDFELGCSAIGETSEVSFYFTSNQATSDWVIRKLDGTTYTTLNAVTTATPQNDSIGAHTLASGPSAGTSVTKVTYTITDGDALDDDNTANMTILDPVGVAVEIIVPTPSGGGGGSSSGSSLSLDAVQKLSATSVRLSGEINRSDNWSLWFSLSSTDSSPSCENSDIKVVVPGTYDDEESFSATATGLVAGAKYYVNLCGESDGALKDDGVEEFTLDGNADESDLLTSLKAQLAGLQAKLAALLNGEGNTDTTTQVVETVCAPFLTKDIRLGAANDSSEVVKLQQFLNEKQGESLALDGSYDQDDVAAVKRFQQKYSRNVLEIWGITEPTGYVHISTRAKINSFYCDRSLRCPLFAEHNDRTENLNINSNEVRTTKVFLTELGFFGGVINTVFDATLHGALVNFQETFSDTILKPWGLTKGTGFKYKTTNKFLNYLAGCETGALQLENGTVVDY